MCAPVEPAEVTLLGSLTAIEGQDLHLTCSASSSNPPAQIRWWLGHKELNASAVIMEEVRFGKQRAEEAGPGVQPAARHLARAGLSKVNNRSRFLPVCQNTENSRIQNLALQSLFPV